MLGVLTTYIYLMTRLRLHKAILPLPSTPTWGGQGNFTFILSTTNHSGCKAYDNLDLNHFLRIPGFYIDYHSLRLSKYICFIHKILDLSPCECDGRVTTLHQLSPSNHIILCSCHTVILNWLKITLMKVITHHASPHTHTHTHTYTL